MNSQQVDKNLTFQVRVNKGWWKILSLLRTDTGKSFKELVEHALASTYMIGEDGKPQEIENQTNNVIAQASKT